MTPYSRLDSENTFDLIWETWINKDGESAGRKAVDVFLKSGYSKSKLLRACETYRLEALGSDAEFTYKLSNFLNQNHWEDVLENASLERLQKIHNEAREVINTWNVICRPHWCKVEDVETKIPMVIQAMRDKAFKKDWMRALDKALVIFKNPLPDADQRGQLILSLRWFCTTLSYKHTVMKLIEGEYGHAPNKYKMPPPQKSKPVDPEERARALEDFNEVFQGMIPPHRLKPKREPKKPVITDEHKKQANKILESLGIETEEISDGPDPFGFLPGVGD